MSFRGEIQAFNEEALADFPKRLEPKDILETLAKKNKGRIMRILGHTVNMTTFYFPCLIFTLFATFFYACSSSDNSTDPPADTEATCEAGDPDSHSELYGHQVFRAFSTDGYEFTAEDVLLVDHASVPEGVVGPDDKLWIYFINGEPGKHGLYVAKEGEDGNFTTTDCVKIDGKFNGDAVDPDIVKLADGRYRLFYFQGNFINPPEPGQGPEHPIYSAISNDGINFTMENNVITVDWVTDPSVVQLPDGTWLMALAYAPDNEGKTILATSTDGTEFTLTGGEIDVQGIPELGVMTDGSVRLYLSKSLISTDGGDTWQEEPERFVPAPDPSLVSLDDGTYVMFYKKFAETND